jgi:hypothetical protein
VCAVSKSATKLSKIDRSHRYTAKPDPRQSDQSRLSPEPRRTPSSRLRLDRLSRDTESNQVASTFNKNLQDFLNFYRGSRRLIGSWSVRASRVRQPDALVPWRVGFGTLDETNFTYRSSTNSHRCVCTCNDPVVDHDNPRGSLAVALALLLS